MLMSVCMRFLLLIVCRVLLCVENVFILRMVNFFFVSSLVEKRFVFVFDFGFFL